MKEKAKKNGKAAGGELKCPNCGAPLKPDDIFCTGCGNPVPNVDFKEELPVMQSPEPEEETHSAELPAEKPKKKKSPVVPILVVLALSICIIIAALIAAHVMDKNEGPEIVTGPVDSSNDFNNEGYQQHINGSPVIETPPPDVEAPAAPGASAEAASAIDERVEGINAGINAGSYSQRKINEQITAFDEGGPVTKILFEINNTQGSDRREYYYENGSLIYANRDWKNFDEFYFDTGSMLRWVHTGSDDISEIRDNLNSAEYQSKAESVLDEARKYYNKATEALKNIAPEASRPQQENKPAANEEKPQTEDKPSGNKHSTADDYMLPDSNSRYIDKSELAGFSAWECMVARNEIFARRGRIFGNADLRAHFESKSWYNPSIAPEDFDSSVFNDYELQNIDTILQYEQAKGFA